VAMVVKHGTIALVLTQNTNSPCNASVIALKIWPTAVYTLKNDSPFCNCFVMRIRRVVSVSRIILSDSLWP